MRRYCAGNGLDRFGTLTYGGSGQHDPRAVRLEVADFWRRLRSELGGEALPYVWVPEWHKTHGLHAHFAVGRFVHRSVIRRAWGHGFIKIKQLNDLPVGAGAREGPRVAARYLAKYVGKSFDQDRIPGLHRYEVAQGFQPEVVAVSGATAGEALDAACVLMDGRPDRVWDSSDTADWHGPPAVWASWR